MRYFLFLIISIISLSSSAQLTTSVYWTEVSDLPKNETIFYRTQIPLTWKDFKGKPQENNRVAAITVSGFGYKAEMKNMGSTGQLNIRVYCYFSKPKSWVKEGRTTGYILSHEQHHFDVSYLSARIFMERVKKTNFTPANVNTLLPKLYNECCDLMNKMQDDYDGQTRNGQDEDKQDQWHKYINEKLAALID